MFESANMTKDDYNHILRHMIPKPQDLQKISLTFTNANHLRHKMYEAARNGNDRVQVSKKTLDNVLMHVLSTAGYGLTVDNISDTVTIVWEREM